MKVHKIINNYSNIAFHYLISLLVSLFLIPPLPPTTTFIMLILFIINFINLEYLIINEKAMN